MLHPLDDFHVTRAAANVAAERFAYFSVARIGIAPQESGRRHDVAGRAITALRTELLVKAALHGRQMAILGERLDGLDAAASDRPRHRQAAKAARWLARAVVRATFAACTS